MIQSKRECLAALKVSWPVFFAYFPIGLVFGVVFVQSGFPWWLGGLMSALVLSGSVQFVALSMYQQHSAFFAILLTALFIAFRNSFYGLSLLKRYDSRGWKKSLLVFLLVDATYALLLANETPAEQNNTDFCLWISVWVWSYWVLGTVVGGLFAKWIPPLPAFEFVLPAFFLAVAVDYWVKLREWHLVWVPIVVSLLTYWLFPQQYLLFAIIICLMVIVAIEQVRVRRTGGHHGK